MFDGFFRLNKDGYVRMVKTCPFKFTYDIGDLPSRYHYLLAKYLTVPFYLSKRNILTVFSNEEAFQITLFGSVKEWLESKE